MVLLWHKEVSLNAVDFVHGLVRSHLSRPVTMSVWGGGGVVGCSLQMQQALKDEQSKNTVDNENVKE